MSVQLHTLLLLLFAGLNSSIGNLLIKRGRLLAEPNASSFEKLLEINFLSGLVFYGINLLIFAKALEFSPVSVAYPILAGAGFLFLSLMAGYFFEETLGAKEVLGMLFVIIGIWLLAK